MTIVGAGGDHARVRGDDGEGACTKMVSARKLCFIIVEIEIWH